MPCPARAGLLFSSVSGAAAQQSVSSKSTSPSPSSSMQLSQSSASSVVLVVVETVVSVVVVAPGDGNVSAMFTAMPATNVAEPDGGMTVVAHWKPAVRVARGRTGGRCCRSCRRAGRSAWSATSGRPLLFWPRHENASAPSAPYSADVGAVGEADALVGARVAWRRRPRWSRRDRGPPCGRRRCVSGVVSLRLVRLSVNTTCPDGPPPFHDRRLDGAESRGRRRRSR